jgi:type IV secretory pathway VirB4 component
MVKAVGGDYIDFTFNSPSKINPFDLSALYNPEENELGLKIISLHTLLKIMFGSMTPDEEAVLDRALIAAYKAKGITPEPETQNQEPPLMEDLYKALIGMENEHAASLANRLEKFIKGSFRGLFNQQSTINLKSRFTVFGIKELEDSLRPIAMFLILDFIWTRVKRELKKRILVVDEAWYLMQYPDSASFLYGIAKRARKYYLGVSTITQDVEDFLKTDQGKAIVTNSSLQLLMKQSTAAIDAVSQTFYLSEGEKRLLLACGVGEGLFFAGQNHVAMRVVASQEEHVLITSNPQEKIENQAEKSNAEKEPQQPKPEKNTATMQDIVFNK